ncbi:GntR family transcriptional regulator [Microbacterium sp. LWH3-1.2]|uniref:GntR family transcriptional regulator n=1 Tax=Microbacterium sp. LWH3-1.2 TaxID=3135256 RepID=UPI003430785C
MTQPGPRGELLVEAIRDLIIAGELAPGSRVTEPYLAGRFGVSRVPVREGLRALAAEGLIDLRPYGSPTVAKLTEEVVREVRAARNILEPPAAREAALHRTDEHVAIIDSILAEGDEALKRAATSTINRLNTRFHDAIASACGNAVLSAFVHVLSSRSEWINTATITPDNENLWCDHHEIRFAIAAGDGPLAEALMVAHVQRATSATLLAATRTSRALTMDG